MTKIKLLVGLAIASIAFVCFAQKTISPIAGGTSSGNATNVVTGKTLWVDAVNGSDVNGARGNLSKPFASLGKAKTNALAGDTVMVLAGSYTNNDLGKAGVNWFFMDGSRVYFTDSGSGAGYGFFDDRSSGATTNTVEGLGEFTYDSPGNTNVLGPFVVTNRLSEITFRARRIIFRDTLGGNAVSGCIAVKNCKSVYAYLDELVDLDFGHLDSYCSGIYWEGGETHVTVNRIKMDDGYLIWAKENATGTTNGLWVTANQMVQVDAVGGTGAIQVDALTDPFRVWIDAKEITTAVGAAYRQSGGGRVYVRAEKINSGDQFPVQLLGGNLWLDSQKLTGKGWLNVSGGFLWGNVNHFEDLGGGTTPGLTFSGGTNYLRGGMAIITNLPVVRWIGGSVTLEGITANTMGGTLTNAPVWAFSTNGDLTLKNCSLLGGNTNSIFATNAQSITVKGILSIASNINANVTITGLKEQGGTFTAAGFTSLGSVNRITFTGTNGLNTQIGADNATSDNLTNWVGLYYFASGGTNQADFGRFNQFILTNNLQTNLTMWLTNGAPGRMGRIKILGSTNGNNYTVTLLSAQAWLMEWDRNNATNGATTLTVTNNQSVEFDVAFDKTPTNPVVSLVHSRKTL